MIGFAIADHICKQWHAQRQHDEGFRRRMQIFHGPDWEVPASAPTIAAAAYPQVVALARLLISPTGGHCPWASHTPSTRSSPGKSRTPWRPGTSGRSLASPRTRSTGGSLAATGNRPSMRSRRETSDFGLSSATTPRTAAKTARRFGRLDTLINNAGLMLLGPIAGADPQEWDRMIAINVKGLLYTTRAAWNGYGVYNFTKFGVNGFTESLRQEVTQRHVRVGVVEPGGVATELGSHNKPQVRTEMIDPFYQQTEVLAPDDIADGLAYMVTRPRHTAIGELWIMPTEQL